MYFYLSASMLLRVVVPECGGPITANFAGGRGCGGNKYGRGFFRNLANASGEDMRYTLSKNLESDEAMSLLNSWKIKMDREIRQNRRK